MHIRSCHHCGSGSAFANYTITYQIDIKNTGCEIYLSAVSLIIIEKQTNTKIDG